MDSHQLYAGKIVQNHISIAGSGQTAIASPNGESFGDDSLRLTENGVLGTDWTIVMKFKHNEAIARYAGIIMFGSTAYSAGDGLHIATTNRDDAFTITTQAFGAGYDTPILDQPVRNGIGIYSFVVRVSGINIDVFEVTGIKHTGTATNPISADGGNGLRWSHSYDTTAQRRVYGADWHTAQLYRAAFTDEQCWSLIRNPYQMLIPA